MVYDAQRRPSLVPTPEAKTVGDIQVSLGGDDDVLTWSVKYTARFGSRTWLNPPDPQITWTKARGKLYPDCTIEIVRESRIPGQAG